MKTRDTFPGKTYSVHTANGCTVSDDSGWSKEIEAPDGYFTAHGSAVYLSDDGATLREVFKLAPQQKLALMGVLGGNADGLPAGFKRVEYLESDGGQYCNTMREVTISTRVEWESQIVGTSYFGAGAPIGAAWRQTNANGQLIALHSTLYATEYLDGRIFFAFGDTRSISETQYPNEERHQIEIQNAKLYYDSKKIFDFGDAVASHFTKTITFCLFAVNTVNKETEYSITLPYTGRVYGITIYDGDVKKNEFVPCVNTATGAPCMFDLVNKEALYNAGAGDFTYPSERATFARRRVLPDWGKLTEHGLRRLYHAPANYQGELYDYAIEHGYKPIVEPEKPETGYWFPRWKETAEEIVLDWVETEPPTEDYLTQSTD